MDFNKVNNCYYCIKDSRLQDLMMEVCQLSASTLYLFNDQTYRGRCVVVYKEHKKELFEINEKDLALFVKDISNAAFAIHKVFSPDKINYAVFGDKVPHIHFHLVPKYEYGPNWGSAFEITPEEKVILSDEEYNDIISRLKENLLF
jgi:Diadenosine tetraphosphate (Ap4A) hydrolase and other HIT family hydrolases